MSKATEKVLTGGRPCLPVEERQSESYLVRMTIEEKEKTMIFADKMGLSLAELFKSSVRIRMEEEGFKLSKNQQAFIKAKIKSKSKAAPSKASVQKMASHA